MTTINYQVNISYYLKGYDKIGNIPTAYSWCANNYSVTDGNGNSITDPGTIGQQNGGCNGNYVISTITINDSDSSHKYTLNITNNDAGKLSANEEQNFVFNNFTVNDVKVNFTNNYGTTTQFTSPSATLYNGCSNCYQNFACSYQIEDTLCCAGVNGTCDNLSICSCTTEECNGCNQ